MTKIQFTPKLILLSLVSFSVTLAILIGIWFSLNANVVKTKQKLDTEVNAVTSTISGLKIERELLKFSLI